METRVVAMKVITTLKPQNLALTGYITETIH